MDSGTTNSVTILRNCVSTRATRFGVRSNSLAIFVYCLFISTHTERQFQKGGPARARQIHRLPREHRFPDRAPPAFVISRRVEGLQTGASRSVTRRTTTSMA